MAAEPLGTTAIVRDVGGDVLADAAVAAGGRLHELAALVAEAHRQPVDLQLADESADGAVEALGHPVGPRTAARRRPSRCRGSSSARRARPARTWRSRCRRPPGRRVGRDEIGVIGLERAQLADQRVVVGVGDLGCVELVVGRLWWATWRAELVDAVEDEGDVIRLRHRADCRDGARRDQAPRTNSQPPTRCGAIVTRRGVNDRPARRQPGCAYRDRTRA